MTPKTYLSLLFLPTVLCFVSACRRIPGADWPAYSESRMGIQLKCPPTVKPQFTPGRTEQQVMLVLAQKPDLSALIRVIERGGQLPVNLALSPAATQPFAPTGLRLQKITVAGRTAAQLEGNLKAADAHMVEYVVSGARVNYTIQCYVAPASHWPDYQGACEAVRNSFQMTGENGPAQIPAWKGEAHLQHAQEALRNRQYVAAASEFKALADQGDPTAQFVVGQFYARGIIVQQDLSQAAYLYRKAAEQGHGPAQAALADLYLSGHGVKPDAVAARQWLSKAANQGSPTAQIQLALMYVKGLGGARNQSQGLSLLHKAANRGVVPAYIVLGQMYQSGTGVTKDQYQAYFWIELAVRSGDKGAAALANQLAKGLKPAQRASANRKINDWLQHHPTIKSK